MNAHSLGSAKVSRLLRMGLLLAIVCQWPAWADTPPDCAAPASTACYFAFTLPGSALGRMHFYASRVPGAGTPTAALVAVHGHPRDANKTFNAALKAVQHSGALDRSLVVAPFFQVSEADAAPCHTAGVPGAQDGDLLWTCASWMAGGQARNAAGLTSFAALDALVVELHQQWPSLQTVTIAGFSAGAQMVQHAIGFAAVPPAPITLRYVVADPGTWLYFDPVWPAATVAACPEVQRWKYGTEDLPTDLGRSATEARTHYAQADIHYLEGALDSSDAPGTFYKILDKSCAAMAQGPYRMQRGLAYTEYDRKLLAPGKQRRVTTVPGCAHDVACVFAAPEARSALLGN
ncbi:hypothetical protein [Rhodoferax sp.]|uniref:hypothetical protein n=1 Tax=Rhodoferax sp. TaxID=50421 RepID=UPI0025E2E58C|nr:hypothetical protein [Rhodoferax sp.]